MPILTILNTCVYLFCIFFFTPIATDYLVYKNYCLSDTFKYKAMHIASLGLFSLGSYIKPVTSCNNQCFLLRLVKHKTA